MLRLLVLSLALAAPARAQAPDSALVERVVAASHLDLVSQFADSALGPLGMLLPDLGVALPTEAVVADAFRAELRAGTTEPQLREALVYLESEAARAEAARGRAMLGTPMQAKLEAAMVGDPRVALADSALAARYVEASGLGEIPERMVRTMLPRMIRALAPSEAEADSALAQIEAGIAGQRAATLAPMVLGARVQLAQARKADVEAAIAHGESDGGRAVREAALRATVVVMTPFIDGLVEQLRAMMPARAPDAADG